MLLQGQERLHLGGDYRANFSPVKRAEILLQLHDKFQLGLKYKPSCFLENKLTAHGHVVFSARMKFHFDYIDFLWIFQPVYPG